MFKCRHGHEHPDELVDNWGQEGHGDGYGPEPVCVALRTDPLTGAGAVCRGALTYVEGELEEPDPAPPLPVDGE